MAVSQIFQLKGTCNNYDWGRKGSGSLAAQLCRKTPGTGFEIDEDKPYAELWFGDYPDFPGVALESGRPLADLIQENKHLLLGAETAGRFDGHLPFLPKILSIAKILPLQIHPNKSLAAQLHHDDPENFTDANHKPEISIALSKVELFVGWRPVHSISPLFNIPSLCRFVPNGTARWTEDTLRSIVLNLLKADENTVLGIEGDLLRRARGTDSEGLLTGDLQSRVADLLPRLQEQHSAADPGALVALLCMNFLVLEPGESVWIPPDGVHAYLSGDMIECMARSNNMLAAGLCPVADRNNIDLFARTLSFAPDTQLGKVRLPARAREHGIGRNVILYQPPIAEFGMIRIDLATGVEERIRCHRGPLLAIVISGEGVLSGDSKELEVKRGFMFFVASGTEVVWRAKSSMQVYAAVAGGV